MPVRLHHAVLSCVVTRGTLRTHLNERAYARDALLANRASQDAAERGPVPPARGWLLCIASNRN